MKQHIATVHEGQKPQICTICDISFTAKSSLKKHNVDLKNKAHKCNICESSFAFNVDLKRHIANVHEGRKPHKCLICIINFAHNK